MRRTGTVIDEVDHPLMEKAKRDLEARLGRFIGMRLTHTAYSAILDLLREHRREWRRMGVDFPPLVALLNLRSGAVKLVREDLDRASIITTIRNFVIENPELSPLEVAQAVKSAWPDLKMGFVRDTTEDYRDRTDRSLRRQLESPMSSDDGIDWGAVEKAVSMDPSLKKYYQEDLERHKRETGYAD